MEKRRVLGCKSGVLITTFVLVFSGCNQRQIQSEQKNVQTVEARTSEQGQSRVAKSTQAVTKKLPSTGESSPKQELLARASDASQGIKETSSTITQTIVDSVTPAVSREPSVQAIEPARVKKGEVVSLSITGKNLEEARVVFRSAAQEIPMSVDAITAGEEITLLDKNFQEFTAGTYDVIVEVQGKRIELPAAFTVEE